MPFPTPSPSLRRQRPWVLAASVAAMLALAGCGERAIDPVATDANRVERQARQEAAEPRREAADARIAAGATPRAAVGASAEGARETSTRPDTSAMGASADTRGAVPSAGRSVGDTVDDAQLTARVNAALAADKEVSVHQVDVDTRDGVVTLSGTVPTSAAKARASELAKNTKDVKSVNDQITISAS